ncbi:MAG: hypothetical protein ABIG64_03575 [Candidatus Omnitrophota bacterium]
MLIQAIAHTNGLFAASLEQGTDQSFLAPAISLVDVAESFDKIQEDSESLQKMISDLKKNELKIVDKNDFVKLVGIKDLFDHVKDPPNSVYIFKALPLEKEIRNFMDTVDKEYFFFMVRHGDKYILFAINESEREGFVAGEKLLLSVLDQFKGRGVFNLHNHPYKFKNRGSYLPSAFDFLDMEKNPDLFLLAGRNYVYNPLDRVYIEYSTNYDRKKGMYKNQIIFDKGNSLGSRRKVEGVFAPLFDVGFVRLDQEMWNDWHSENLRRNFLAAVESGAQQITLDDGLGRTAVWYKNISLFKALGVDKEQESTIRLRKQSKEIINSLSPEKSI